MGGGAISIHALRVEGDLAPPHDAAQSQISIHALRVEGDWQKPWPINGDKEFLSTPSGWRATYNGPFSYGATLISIHALRVEGDGCDEKFFKDIKISIHALRVEGDPRYRKKSV